MNLEKLKKSLVEDEGLRLKPYLDTAVPPKITIGVGRNLTDKGISLEESELLLENDIQIVITLLNKYLPWWKNLSEERQNVLANLAFNMGIGPSKEEPTGKLLTFKNTLKAMEEGRIEDAAKGLETSLWYKQVGKRASRLVNLYRKG